MKKKVEKIEEIELADNEEFISRDDIDIEVRLTDDGTVMVQFSGFNDYVDAEEYAEFLADTLPLLLFQSTRLQ